MNSMINIKFHYILIFLIIAGFSKNKTQKSDSEIKETIDFFPRGNLVLERVFGSEASDTKEKYLLCRNTALFAGRNYNCGNNITGDILLVDYESATSSNGRILVFDKNCNGKLILGSAGFGPGEFGQGKIPKIFSGPNGYIAILSGVPENPDINLFSPGYKLLYKKKPFFDVKIKDFVNNYFSKDIYRFNIEHFVPISKDSVVFDLLYRKIYKSINKIDSIVQYCSIILYSKNNIQELKILKDANIFISKNDDAITNFGYFFWNITSNNKLVYITTDEEINVNDTETYFFINVKSIENGNTKIIKILCNTPDKYKPQKPEYNPFISKNTELFNELSQKLVKRIYDPAVFRMFVDNKFAFFYTKLGPSKPITTYVINLETETIVYKFTMNSNYSYWIWNGYLYNLSEDKYGYYVIKKYKINPAVYGK